MKGTSTTDLLMKVRLGVIVFLIVASVFGLNNQFSHDAVATANPNNFSPDKSTFKGNNNDSPQGGGSNNNDSPQGGGSNNNDSPQGGGNSGDSATQRVGAVPASTSAMSDHGSGGNGGSNDKATFRHNAQDIAPRIKWSYSRRNQTVSSH